MPNGKVLSVGCGRDAVIVKVFTNQPGIGPFEAISNYYSATNFTTILPNGSINCFLFFINFIFLVFYIFIFYLFFIYF